LNKTSLFWAHSANAILWCFFRTVSLGNTVILYGYKFKPLFNIHCANRLDIRSCAAAFFVVLLGFFAAPLWWYQWSPKNAQMKVGDVSSKTLNHHY
jgi:hypothetical protein